MLGLGIGNGTWIEAITGGGYTPTDPDAIAYFNSIGDVPVYAQKAIENRIVSFKINGTWNGLKLCYLFPPTLGMFDYLRDVRSNTIYGSVYLGGSVISTPFISASVLGGNQGMIFNGGSGHIRTGFIPSSHLTLNDTAWAVGLPEDIAASAQFSFGAFNSSTQSMVFQKRNASNQLFADMYGNTTTSGRAQQTGTSGAGGVFIANRVASNDFKVYRNGTQIASTANAQGSLPSVQWYLRGFNNNGGTYSATDPKNEPYSFFCIYGNSLSVSQLAAENTAWSDFITDMFRDSSYGGNIVFDGNSHFVYYNGINFRSAQVENRERKIKWSDIAVSGQTTETMVTNQAANLFPLFSASLGTNICVVTEATNHISGGATAQQAFDAIEDYCENVRTYWTANSITGKIVVVPVIARKFTAETGKILVSNDYNELLRDNYTDFADAFVTPNPSLWLWRDDYSSDANYITAIQALCDVITIDGTHLTESNYQAWGSDIGNAIKSIL
jgi:lysophospholipase L1-like esterase